MHFTVSKTGDMYLSDIVLAGGFGTKGTSATDRKKELLWRRRDTDHDVSMLHEWLRWDKEAEHRAALEQEPNVPDNNTPIHWACPLKQRFYLSGQAGVNFRPSLPNQRRAARLFTMHNQGDVSSTRKRSNSSSGRPGTCVCACRLYQDIKRVLFFVVLC